MGTQRTKSPASATNKDRLPSLELPTNLPCLPIQSLGQSLAPFRSTGSILTGLPNCIFIPLVRDTDAVVAKERDVHHLIIPIDHNSQPLAIRRPLSREYRGSLGNGSLELLQLPLSIALRSITLGIFHSVEKVSHGMFPVSDTLITRGNQVVK